MLARPNIGNLPKQLFQVAPRNKKETPVTLLSNQNNLLYLAYPSSPNIDIYSKSGEIIASCSLPNEQGIINMCIEPNGNNMAVMTSKSVFVGKSSDFQSTFRAIDIGNSIPTSIQWSFKESILAIGTSKGDIIFYSNANAKKLVTEGKHSKKVTTLLWNENNLLLSYGDDKNMIISKANGETSPITQEQNKYLHVEADLIKWFNTSEISRHNFKSAHSEYFDSSNVIVSAIKNRKVLQLHNVNSNNKPVLINFSATYGKIVNYYLHNTRTLVIAFQKGNVATFDILNNDINEEINSDRFFINSLDAVSLDKLNGRLIIAGDNCIKQIDLLKFKELNKIQINYEKNMGNVLNIHHNDDVNYITVSTISGYVFGILYAINKMPVLGNLLVYKQHYNEIKVYGYDKVKGSLSNDFGTIVEESNEIEGYAVYGNNIYVHFGCTIKCYRAQNNEIKKISEIEVESPIIHVYSIENRLLVAINKKLITYNLINLAKISELTLNIAKNTFVLNYDNKFIYLLHNNELILIELSSFKILYNHKFSNPVNNFKLNRKAFYFILYGCNGKIYYFNLKDSICVEVEQGENSKVANVYFDEREPNTFALLHSTGNIYTYVTSIHHYKNPDSLKLVKEVLKQNDFHERDNIEPVKTVLSKGLDVLDLTDGYITCLDRNNNIVGCYLASHSFKLDDEAALSDSIIELAPGNIPDEIKEQQLKKFYQNLELLHFNKAFESCCILKRIKLWDFLSHVALEHLDITTAANCFQKIGNYSMAFSLNHIRKNKPLLELKANVALMLCDYDLAKDYYIKSNNILSAIYLLSDLHEFEKAVELATQQNLTYLIPKLLLELAEQSLKNEEFIKALSQFEEVINKSKNVENGTQLVERAMAGLAMIYLKQGNFSRTSELIKSLNDKDTIEHIADTAAELKHHILAGELYCRNSQFDKTLVCYINAVKSKRDELHILENFLDNNINNIKDNSIFVDLGLLYQSIGNLKLAEKYIYRSGDYVELVKFYLMTLHDPAKAETIFESKCSESQTAANYLAEYFINSQGDKKKAIKFFIFAGRRYEAFRKATEEDLLDVYCDNVAEFDVKEAQTIANYLEKRYQFAKAGKFYYLCYDYEKSLICFIKAKDYEDAIDLVIKLKSEELFEFLVQIFSGETALYIEDDGREVGLEEPVDPIYLFDLYLQFDKVENANQIALAILEKKIGDGNYNLALKVLLDMKSKLEASDLRNISFELKNKFVIFQSYHLVKKVLKLENHTYAAELLNRVCNYINYFPKHAVQIMTSSVIESTKAGYKDYAYTWAINLCKPDYRDHINPKFKDKIEKIALKPVTTKSMNLDIIQGNCIICSTQVNSVYDLQCNNCKNSFFMCFASGKAIININNKKIVKIPEKYLYAYLDELQLLLESDALCPLTDEYRRLSDYDPVSIEDIKKVMRI